MFGALTACAGSATVVHTEVKSDLVTQLQNVAVVSDLNQVLPADLFQSFWAITPAELQKRGLKATMLAAPVPRSLTEHPSVDDATLMKVGANRVLSIGYDELGTRTVGGHVYQLDIIVTISDVTTRQVIWSTRLEYAVGGTIRGTEVRARRLLELITMEMQKAGFLG
jgi:hypothetical protein